MKLMNDWVCFRFITRKRLLVKDRILIFKLEISNQDESANKIQRPLAGNGQTCKGNGQCGDNGEAVKASLTYPKVKIEKLYLEFMIF